ncbi:RusA-like Holliday junction resolvase [Klebsiella phage vB_Kpn_ZC2]|uniref:RusA-like Holliday junction resolvase n=1 Tax=Klebsiella phage vB_Kpn_ZC2 TaxID=2982901 RepID=UPI00233E922F|nr:RusA-like Holliday junction resolvase [Klebsiella phage vB_Kpn_ZC2]UZN98696.1 DNA polymerase III beta subunit [Klebsiella phage vB_Kpn_ZC2]
MPEGCKTTHDKGEVMKLKISKLLLEGALMFQAKQDVRYYLNGICFMPDGRVSATDGHRAMIASKHENKLKDNVIVSVSKSPTKRYAYALLDTETNIVTYHDEHEVMVGAGICSEINGNYPDIDRIIPKQTAPAEQIGFNAKYLADVEKLAKLFNPKFEAVLFELNGNTSAAVAKISAPTGETAKVIVMPMRI